MIAYPLYGHSTYRSADRVNERRYLLPFYWSWRLQDRRGQVRQTRVKVWPFVSWARSGESASSLEVLSPLWFRDPDGFERNYGPLWTWYRRGVSETGATRMRLFWYEWEKRAAAEADLEAKTKAHPTNRSAPEEDLGPALDEPEQEPSEIWDPLGPGRLGELFAGPERD